MIYWNLFKKYELKLEGKKNTIDTNIYTFDIETTSYFLLDDVLHKSLDYKDLDDKEQKRCEFKCNMYIWMFGINDTIYYGRTWQEFKKFVKLLEDYCPYKKLVFVHNLAFEFQFLEGEFNFKNVKARKSHKVMKCEFEDYNFEFRCSYFMSNCSLKNLAEVYNLEVQKKDGDLDYTLLRHSETPLTDIEMEYCEYDCLVVYYYILKELDTYKSLKKLPLTSTGHVRNELKDRISKNYKYKAKVKKAVNTDPHVYNLLIESFMGGYTHANVLYTGEIINNVSSWDFTSSYPYVLVTHRFPSTKFKRCKITRAEQMLDVFAYLVVVEINDIKCKYWNNFISKSKCREIVNGEYDNGRIISADKVEMVLTDVDFKFYLETYKYSSYNIKECYYSLYNYLPIEFIDFVLEKYVNKTKYKNVVGKETEYALEKSKFNSLYGMSVTNNIRDEVEFDNKIGWQETELSNETIVDKLLEEEKKGFLSFAYGVWVTAYARQNLLKNVCKLDKWVVYCDTDSIKVVEGYDKKVIEDYNSFVKNKIEYVSHKLDIPLEKFAPKDIKGKERMLGLFDSDGFYEEFITQGAKKYAVKDEGEIKITVAGVPKKGSKALTTLEDFKDDLVFRYEDTGKNLLFYVDYELPSLMTDYLGNTYEVTDKSGCCLCPTTYVLGKSLEYADLVDEISSKRAIYKENKDGSR